jgi:hypothetical protein
MRPVAMTAQNPGPQKEVLRQITYAPFPWETHPIDTVPTQQQGWGPFWGPWQQVDFADPQAAIDLGYSGSNAVTYGPGYADITIFKDPSTSLVNNKGILTTIENLIGLGNGTVAGTAPPSFAPSSVTPLSRVKRLLGIGQ